MQIKFNQDYLRLLIIFILFLFKKSFLNYSNNQILQIELQFNYNTTFFFKTNKTIV